MLTLTSKSIISVLQQSLIGLLGSMMDNSQNIGLPKRTIEIDDSKIGRRKYNRGHKVKGQWVFHGVERESGKIFLVPVPDANADRLMTVRRDQIEPGTTVPNDCWLAYRDIKTHGFTHTKL